MKFAVFAKKTPVKRTRKEFPSSCAAAAKQTGSEFPSSCAAAAEQTGSEFPSSGGVSAEQTGWLQAFTLAETLIALTIIGVIAAITVPALVQRTNKQEYVTALQKAYSTLSQAANMIIAENGSPKGDDGWASSDEAVYEMLKKYLNNAKECRKETGCYNVFNEKNHKYLNNKYPDNNELVTSSSTSYLNLVLADGQALMVRSANKQCSMRDWSGSTNNGICSVIYIDVNGRKKPNIIGRDTFAFLLKENGIFPAGCDYNNACISTGLGYDCTCKVLREGAVNY